ncbi:ABC transporter permease [Asanoa sp. WMMD1127]|uniref:ABC transporter permease n=1 Tax=Asanoa sp. WMMD1127 TaxID=3016107 RepID=UPI002417F0CB|nr:ABC transporter permease [Asanoa sp. WMMD1127]MDG4824733.1 ABC transporter permease [Asanoa sp. WMMD1127]
MTALRAVRGEWTKLRTLPSTGWLLVGVVVGTVALGLAITASLDQRHCAAPCLTDPVKLSLAGVRLGQVAVVILAVLAVTAEYATRTIQPTLAAVPRRALVVLGKAVVLVTLTLAAGALGVAASYAAAGLALDGSGFDVPTWSDRLDQRAAVGTVLYLGLIAAFSAGLGLLLRDTAGAITTGLLVLYGTPVAASLVSDPRWEHRLLRFSPMDAGLSIQATRDFAAEHIGPWAGLGMLSAYAGGALLLGLLVFALRDAR